MNKTECAYFSSEKLQQVDLGWHVALAHGDPRISLFCWVGSEGDSDATTKSTLQPIARRRKRLTSL